MTPWKVFLGFCWHFSRWHGTWAVNIHLLEKVLMVPFISQLSHGCNSSSVFSSLACPMLRGLSLYRGESCLDKHLWMLLSSLILSSTQMFQFLSLLYNCTSYDTLDDTFIWWYTHRVLSSYSLNDWTDIYFITCVTITYYPSSPDV